MEQGCEGSADRVLNLNSIMFQSASGRTIKFYFSFFVNRHSGGQIQFGDREIALRSHGLVS